MPKVTDPDLLTSKNTDVNGSVIFKYTNPLARTIKLADKPISASSAIDATVSGSNTGVTLQALYSFCKEEWKTDSTLIKIPFPFISITKNQFDVVNNWDFEDNATRYLIRDAGWSVRSGSANVSVQEWAGIVTLGALDEGTPINGTNKDQVYYTQTASLKEPPADFQMPGEVNHAVQVYSASYTGGGTVFDRRGYMKVFVRTWQKTYANASVQTDLQVPTMEYTVYSLPLVNATDVKITETNINSATGSPYNATIINYLSGSGFSYYGSGQSYPAGMVVYDNGASNRWFIHNTPRTTAGATVAADNGVGGTWVTWSAANNGGERQVGSGYYAYNIIIDAGGSKAQTAAQIYTGVQYKLKLDPNINDSLQTSARSGSVSDLLLRFVGDTLITANGVYIDNFQDADTNSIDFYDVSGSVHRFPFVATGVISFNDNLSSDTSASFWMFFTSVPSGSYGSASAVVVDNNLSKPITGSIAGSSSYSFTFDYDFNVQGGRTSGSDAPVTVVAIGLGTAQFVTTTATITRSKTNNISLVSALERNYSNPT